MLCSQDRRYCSSHSATSRRGALWRRQGLLCASRLRLIKPARSRTLRCFVMEGAVIENGLASSFTHNSPRERRARIARLVGSERAANVELSWSGTYLTTWLISHTAKYLHRRDCVKQKLKRKSRSKTGDYGSSAMRTFRRDKGTRYISPRICYWYAVRAPSKLACSSRC
jgi:hypothetical protein